MNEFSWDTYGIARAVEKLLEDPYVDNSQLISYLQEMIDDLQDLLNSFLDYDD